MKGKIVLVFLFSFSLSLSYAQTNFVGELYQYNYAIINPAFVGDSGQRFTTYSHINAYGRHQNSVTSYLGYETNVKNIGFGFIGFAEWFGPVGNTRLSLPVNYGFKIGANKKLIFAIQPDYNISSLDPDLIIVIDPGDPILSPRSVTSTRMSLSSGILFKSGNIFAGFGVRGLNFWSGGNDNQIFYNATAGYSKSWSVVEATGSVMLCFIDRSNAFSDLNASVLIDKHWILGGSVRGDKDGVYPRFMGGVKIGESVQIIFLGYSSYRRDSFFQNSGSFRGEMMLQFLMN